MTRLNVAIVQAGPDPLDIGGKEVLHPEIDLGEIGQGLASHDTDGHYSRPDVFELCVDTRAKDGVNWH